MSNPQVPFSTPYVNSDVGPNIPNETNKHIVLDSDAGITETHRGRKHGRLGTAPSDLWVWEEGTTPDSE